MLRFNLHVRLGTTIVVIGEFATKSEAETAGLKAMRNEIIESYHIEDSRETMKNEIKKNGLINYVINKLKGEDEEFSFQIQKNIENKDYVLIIYKNENYEVYDKQENRMDWHRWYVEKMFTGVWLISALPWE